MFHRFFLFKSPFSSFVMDRIRNLSNARKHNRVPESSNGFSFQAFDRSDTRSLVGPLQENHVPDNATWLSTPRRPTVRNDGPVLSQHFRTAREFLPCQVPNRFIGRNDTQATSTSPRESRVAAPTGGRLTFGPPTQVRAKPETSPFPGIQSISRKDFPLPDRRPSKCFGC